MCGVADHAVDENDRPKGVCTLPPGHDGRWHREYRHGVLWAEWSGEPSPAVSQPVTEFSVRDRFSHEPGVRRIVIHTTGFPFQVKGSATTRWGARRLARRWHKRNIRALESEAV